MAEKREEADEARRFLDEWEKRVSSSLRDPALGAAADQLAEAWMAMARVVLERSAAGAAEVTATDGDDDGTERGDRAGNGGFPARDEARGAAARPTGTPSPGSPPAAGAGALAELAGRLDAVEERLRRLEAGGRSRGAAKPRRPGGGD